MTLLLGRYASFTRAICSRSEIWVVKLSLEPIQWIDSNIWLTRCIFGYPKFVSHCEVVFWRAWMLIVSHQVSNLIKRMEIPFWNSLGSFEEMLNISLISWIVTRSISAKLQVISSVPALDRRTCNCSRLSAAMFAALSPSSLAAVCSSSSCLANMLLWPVLLVPSFCASCRSWCWNNFPKRLRLAGVTWWISRSNRSIAF